MRINGRDFRIPELDFSMVRKLEDSGISFFDLQKPKKKYFSIITAFAGMATQAEPEEVDYLLQQHLLGGGTFDGWIEEILKAVESSGFFQVMMKRGKAKANLHAVKEPTETE